jgi:hypothetical protein
LGIGTDKFAKTGNAAIDDPCEALVNVYVAITNALGNNNIEN